MLTNKSVYVFKLGPAATGPDYKEEFLLVKWKYTDPPPIIFDSENGECFLGTCDSAFRIDGYKFELKGRKKENRVAYEILTNHGVQVDIFTREMGKAFEANYGVKEEDILYKQFVLDINSVVHWNGHLIITKKDIYLFSKFFNRREVSGYTIGALYPHEFTDEYLVGKWKYTDDQPKMVICLNCPLPPSLLRVDRYRFHISTGFSSKKRRKKFGLLKSQGIPGVVLEIED